MRKTWKITVEEVMELAAADDNLGICVACGEVAEGVEPDARNYRCEGCGKTYVFGAEAALLRIT